MIPEGFVIVTIHSYDGTHAIVKYNGVCYFISMDVLDWHPTLKVHYIYLGYLQGNETIHCNQSDTATDT